MALITEILLKIKNILFNMDCIYEHLLSKGFIKEFLKNDNSKLNFKYSFTIAGFAEYNFVIKSYNNWIFRMETEKISLSNSVVGFSNHTCFLGVISSNDSINILEVILSATGINEIIETNNVHKNFNK